MKMKDLALDITRQAHAGQKDLGENDWRNTKKHYYIYVVERCRFVRSMTNQKNPMHDLCIQS